jgi:glutathionylspermidine synthase
VEHNTSSRDLTSYRSRREYFFEQFGIRWPGTLLEPFDLLELYPLSTTEISAIYRAGLAISRIYKRIATVLRTVSDDTLLQMGLPARTLALARLQISGMCDCVIGRLDLALTADGYKLLEFNADTPGMVVESFPVNAAVCELAGRVDPNSEGEAALRHAIECSISAGLAHVLKKPGQFGNVVFTSYATCERDQDITNYLMGLPRLPPSVQKQFVPLQELRADEDGFYDSEGSRIDVLFRFFPLQFFSARTFKPRRNAPEAMLNGTLLFDLISQRKLAIVNPPAAFLLGNKAIQSVVWGLYERREYFNHSERDVIEQYFLPTYMDAMLNGTYVVKPVYGDEGDSITIRDGNKRVLLRSNNSTYTNQPMVYQKYLELPQVRLMTEDGIESLQILTSCFLIDGKPIGICLRAGRGITDFSWWYLPVCIEG